MNELSAILRESLSVFNSWGYLQMYCWMSLFLKWTESEIIADVKHAAR